MTDQTHETIDAMLLDRYLAGQCSAEEGAVVRRWIERAPERSTLVEALQQMEESESASQFTPNPERWLAWAEAHIAQNEQPRTIVFPPAKQRWLSSWMLRAAAVLLVCVGAGLLWWRLANGGRNGASPATHLTEVATARGQRATLTLSDGTRVILSVASRLRYAPQFKNGLREVYLDGEGYFDVRHDARHPFIVHTAQGVAEDLGTQFVVRSYPEDHRLHVAVLSGEVGLRPKSGERSPSSGKPQREAHLRAGDLGQVANGIITTQHNVDLERYSGWTEGKLVFKDTPFRDAIPELSRWYNVDLQVADSAVASRVLTAVLRDQPLTEILRSLSLSLDARYEQRGRTILFFSRP